MKKNVIKFSCVEIEEAGFNTSILKNQSIPIDPRRKSLKPENVEKLKQLIKNKPISTEKKAKSTKKKVKPSPKKAPIKVEKIEELDQSIEDECAPVDSPEEILMDSAVKVVFEKQPVYGSKAALLKALEEHVCPIADATPEEVFKTLKDGNVIQYSRSSPRGYSLN